MHLVTFHIVGAALQLETMLEQANMQSRVVPVPRRLSSGCGYAVQVEQAQAEPLAGLLRSSGLEWETLYEVQLNGAQEDYVERAKQTDEA
jgi:hypothetical protein